MNKLSVNTLVILATASISTVPVDCASAQVIYSVGTQQVYDTNIFLEDKKLSESAPKDANGNLLEQADGDLNGDFISNPYVSLSGKIPTGSKITAAYTAKVGFILYNENTDQNRAALDGVLSIAPKQEVLPQYVTLAFTNTLSSQANAIGVAQGGAARQGQLNTAALSAGVTRYQLGSQDSITNLFNVSRQDFLGQFELSSRDEAISPEIPGVDSFSYGMNTRFDHTLSSALGIFAANNINYFDVTGGESGDLGATGNTVTSGLDRVNISPSIGLSYQANQRWQITGSTGVDFSQFAEDSPSNSNVGLAARDNTQSSIFYGLSTAYTISERSAVSLNLLQSAGTDVNGGRLMSRSLGATGSYMLNNRWSGNLSGQLAQFTVGDSLSDPTDRYELTAAAKYALSHAWALSFGYSYVNQDAADGRVNSLFNGGDFEGHRAFVSLDTGFMGFFK
jgi:hypothetical protein